MKHTNEELVRRIQSGQREYIPQLWDQVYDFIKYMADKHLLHYPQNCQQFYEDMVNQSYFYFLKAIDGYKEGKGKFTSYLSFHIRNAFNDVLQGRTTRTQNEHLNSYVSLDTPVEDTDDLTLADMLIDTQGEAYYRRVEDYQFWDSVNDLIRQAIDTLPEEWQDFFLIMLQRGTKLTDTMRIMGAGLDTRSHWRCVMEKGLRKIRQFITRYCAREKGKNIALDECISYYTGVGAWKNHCLTSSVELAVMKRVDTRLTAESVYEILSIQ